MKICAVIPAAGLGSRLNLPVPRLLAPISGTRTLWHGLREKLTLVDHIHVVASPSGAPALGEALKADLDSGFVSMSIQPKPIGMGDAIFQGRSVWSTATIILVVWGDQAFVSQDTLARSLALHQGASKTVVLPLVKMHTPYVEYLFDGNGRLSNIKQSREQEICKTGGWSDVGTFVLSVPDLQLAWQDYLHIAQPGHATQEWNFLPFLPYLSRAGWTIDRLEVEDSIEARGINTPEDLRFIREI